MRECHPWAPIIDASRNPSIIPIASPVVPLAVMIHSTVVMEAPFRSALKRTLCEITSTLSQRLESGGIESGDESGESGDGNRGTPYLFPFLWWAGDPPRTEGVANKGPVPTRKTTGGTALRTETPVIPEATGETALRAETPVIPEATAETAVVPVRQRRGLSPNVTMRRPLTSAMISATGWVEKGKRG